MSNAFSSSNVQRSKEALVADLKAIVGDADALLTDIASATSEKLAVARQSIEAMLVTTVGCALTSKQEGTGEYVDDSVITAKVKAAILNEPTLKVAEINVEAFKGVVQLSGFVSSPTSMNKVVEVTRHVGGVKSVKNDIRIK